MPSSRYLRASSLSSGGGGSYVDMSGPGDANESTTEKASASNYFRPSWRLSSSSASRYFLSPGVSEHSAASTIGE